MKNIALINTVIPSDEPDIQYCSDQSLLDYDIVVFDPTFPHKSRIEFDGGGSCVSIEGSRALIEAMSHWSHEIKEALKSGKTVFVIMSSLQNESFATGYSTPRKDQRSYSTQTVKNYTVLPVDLNLRNAKGRRFSSLDSSFRGLYHAIDGSAEYKVVIGSSITKNVFVTPNGTSVVGGVCNLEGFPGKLVLVPDFGFDDEDYDFDNEKWSTQALSFGKRVLGEIVSIDKALRKRGEGSPKPDWTKNVKLPSAASALGEKINNIGNEINQLLSTQEELTQERAGYEKFSGLLYETGKPLESLIEESLTLMGYQSENFTEDDLEFDHVIVGPSGLRMLGESEGKDTSAIGITKFRQLESNINEDFARDEVEAPAKGVLFGNGYRLEEPDAREDCFTKKCMTNAARLGTALVQTTDLYDAVLHILDNPEDDEFKEACRAALETTVGEIVRFPHATE